MAFWGATPIRFIFGIASHSFPKRAGRGFSIPAIALLFLALCGCEKTSVAPQTSVPHRGVFAGAHRALASGFELNQGQWDSRVKFRAGTSRNLFLTDSGFVIALSQPVDPRSAKSALPIQSEKHPSKVSKSFLGLEFIGANPHPTIRGEKLLPGKSNYFIGNDPTKWKRNVPHYAVVRYSDLYPGIDLIVHENATGATEYDLLTAPGADPTQIELGIRGARSAKLDRSGELVLDTLNGSVIGHAPTLYQDIDGVRKSVAGGYVLRDSSKVGFKVGAYDHGKPLMIDPTIFPSYSTFLGGSGTDTGTGIAVDAIGAAYVTGNTTSTDFPTTSGALQTTSDSSDAFVTKLSPDGTSLIYSTYLSGFAYGIAVDTNGSAYVAGRGGVFPQTPGYQGGPGGDFVVKLNSDGSQLIYAASLGTQEDFGITVDSTGNAYLASESNSQQAEVAKLNAAGSALIYQTALHSGSANAITLDSAGEAFVVGSIGGGPGCQLPAVWKVSADGSQILYFYTGNCNAIPTGIGVDSDGNAYAALGGVITKLDPSGNSIAYPNLLSNDGFIQAIAVDPSGIAYVTGRTHSATFPTTSDAFQSQLPGQQSAFISRIDASGSVLLYSSFFGGSSIDNGNAIALDPENNGYFTGYTTSSDFPHTGGAFQGSLKGNQNAFVAEFQFPVVPTPTPTLAQSTPTSTVTVAPPTLTPTPRKTSAPIPTRTPNGSPSATVTRTPAPTTQATTPPTPTPTITPTMTAAATPTTTATVTATPTPVPVGPLIIAPAQINFGRVRVGTTSVEHLVRLVNPARNKSPLMITSLGLASAPASGFEIDSLKSSCHVGDSIASGRSCTVFIAFAPPGQGASSDNLVVTGNFTNSGHHLPLVGIGF